MLTRPVKTQATALVVHRYQFNCKTQTRLKLNSYSGSMLRGAFGHALRQSVCVTKMDDCSGCLLYRQCVYTQIFETPVPKDTGLQHFSAIPKPFIIEPSLMGKMTLEAGALFTFDFVLIGTDANRVLGIMIDAWKIALKRGLGADYSRLTLNSVDYKPEYNAPQRVYDHDTLTTEIDYQTYTADIKPIDSITLEFNSPLQIKKHGRVLSNDMTAKDFLMALIRRYYLLHEFYGTDYHAPNFSDLAMQATNIECQTDFTEFEWQRYSSRQKQSMQFRGVLGSITLSGTALSYFLPMLIISRNLHVGNKTTFGMGHYKII